MIGDRRVLMIAAAFPPTGGPGVQRTAKFAKYLPRYGWAPTIWTLDRMDAMPEDETLLSDLPYGTRVHRFGGGRSLRRVQRLLHRVTSRGGPFAPLLRPLDWRLDRWLGAHHWPDEYASWVRASAPVLRRLIRSEGFDAIYSTFSPASNHLLALRLKRRTGLPWVADFRDLWTDDLRYAPRTGRWMEADLDLQQSVLQEANCVIGVTPTQTRVLAKHVPDEGHKFGTITNGFDPADFEAPCARPGSVDRPFTLAHVGRLDHGRAGPELVEGLSRFADTLGRRRDRFRLVLVGHANTQTQRQLYQARIAFENHGYVSHAKAIEQMRLADALLLVTDATGVNAATVIRAKLFEYLAAGRPILVVGPPGGECERIVNDCQSGEGVAFEAAAIARAVARMFHARERGRLMTRCHDSRLERYSRVNLAKKLASLLDRACGSSHRSDRPSSRVASLAPVS